MPNLAPVRWHDLSINAFLQLAVTSPAFKVLKKSCNRESGKIQSEVLDEEPQPENLALEPRRVGGPTCTISDWRIKSWRI